MTFGIGDTALESKVSLPHLCVCEGPTTPRAITWLQRKKLVWNATFELGELLNYRVPKSLGLVQGASMLPFNLF